MTRTIPQFVGHKVDDDDAADELSGAYENDVKHMLRPWH